MKKLLLVMILLVALVGCVPGGEAARTDGAQSDEGTVYDPPKPIADFTLMSNTGKPLRFGELQGRPVLVFFGFTHCPDVCPMTLTEWTKVKQNLGADADKVAFVFISVDGARDTPDVVDAYVRSYDPAFIGLTGDQGMLLSISRDFGSYAKLPDDVSPTGTYDVMHGSYSFLVNATGQLEIVYRYGIPADVISDDIRAMLQSL